MSNLTAAMHAAARLTRSRRRQLFALIFATSIGALLSGIGDPLALKLLIDTLGARNRRAFVAIAALFLVMYTAIRLVRWWTTLLAQQLKNSIYDTTTNRMFHAFFCLPFNDVQKEPGYYISRISDEPLQVTKGIDFFVSLTSSTATLAGAFAMCMWLSWKITMILSVIVPALLWLAQRYGASIGGAVDRENESQAEFRAVIGRAAESYKTVNMFDLRAIVDRLVSDRLVAYLDLFYRRVRIAAAFQALSGILLSYAEMAVLLGAGVQVLKGNLTIGGMFGFTSAYWRVVASCRTLSELLPQGAELMTYLLRLQEFEARADTAQARAFAERNARGEHQLMSLVNAKLSFDSTPLFDDLTISVGPAERLLISGPNGSGKTTLAHVLAGFQRLDSGVAHLPLRSRVSALLRPFYFIPGTLRDNVAFGRLDDAERKQFFDIAHRFGLTQKLDQDPASFSEGEKSKAQVLLTLMKRAEYYVFDEPLAHVDTTSKAVVMSVILEHTEGKAVIAMMHGDEEHRRPFPREVMLDRATAEFLALRGV